MLAWLLEDDKASLDLFFWPPEPPAPFPLQVLSKFVQCAGDSSSITCQQLNQRVVGSPASEETVRSPGHALCMFRV